MRRLTAFYNTSIDGFFTGANGDLSWAYQDADDKEWNEFVAGNARGGGALLLGRVTYEMMAGYWSTHMAMQSAPAVAERMNAMRKFVASKSLDHPGWENTRLLSGNLADEVRRLKSELDEDIAILGSGSIVSQLSNEQLIDEYQAVFKPVVLGSGRTIFDGLPSRLNLHLVSSRVFANGNVYLRYEPKK